MAPRPLKTLGLAITSLLLCMAVAAPAMGQTGNGLYEPFPAAASKERAKRFVSQLPGAAGKADPVSVNASALAHGVVVDARALGPASASGAPASRGLGGGGFDPSLGWPLALALAALALAAPLALAARRRS